MCTIILPWGKYSYLRLPMGVAGSPAIFQEKMSGVMETLDYVRTYLDDLLVISKSSFDNHLTQIETVSSCLRDAGLRINAAKSFFAEAARSSTWDTYSHAKVLNLSLRKYQPYSQ